MERRLLTQLFEPSSGFADLGSIPGQGKKNAPVFHHEVSMLLCALFSNV